MLRASHISIFLIAIVTLADANLYASCCSSAATGGVGRLLKHERALVEMSMNTKVVTGSFNNQSHFSRGVSAMDPYLTVEPELAMVVRVFDFLEPFAKLPVRIQKSSARVGAHLADISLGARTSLLRENFITGFPSLTLIGSARLPTGASMKEEPMLAAEDTTGTGSYLYSLSVLLEKEIAAVTFSLGYGLSLESDYFDRSAALTPGFMHSPLIAAAFMPHEGGLLSCTWSMLLHGTPQFETRPLIDADRRKMTVALAYSVGLHSHIKFNAQLGSDVPIDYIGKNFTSEAFIRFGLRFGVF